ncbi:uncharacterized protein V6R79_025393 [Siganus canaliculatus]
MFELVQTHSQSSFTEAWTFEFSLHRRYFNRLLLLFLVNNQSFYSHECSGSGLTPFQNNKTKTMKKHRNSNTNEVTQLELKLEKNKSYQSDKSLIKTGLSLDRFLDTISQQQLCLFGESQTGEFSGEHRAITVILVKYMFQVPGAVHIILTRNAGKLKGIK